MSVCQQLIPRRAAGIIVLWLLGVNASAQDGPYLAENAPEDCVFQTTPDNFYEIVETKSPEAMASWPDARSRYLDGLPEQHSLFVTFFLTDEAGRAEYVFLAVDDISPDGVSGRLWTDLVVIQDIPFGARILLEEVLIKDWLITRPDGSEEGNLVGKYIDTLQQCQDRDASK